MYNYFTELMLNEYFTACAIFEKFTDQKGELFSALSRIFLIPEKEAEALYDATEDERVREIVTAGDYMQYQRIKRYAQLTGGEVYEGLDELIDIKGSAIVTAGKYKIIEEGTPTEAAAARILMAAADSGLVLAMNILGVLECEGIVFNKNTTAGLGLILKTALWNSEEGLMAALYYGGRRADFMAQMKVNLEKASRTESYAALEKAYGVFPVKPPKTYSLLQKAVEQGVLKREEYSKQYARILFSALLPFKDKENLFFSPNKEQFADAANLPLKLSAEAAVEYESSSLGTSSVIREAERGEFLKILENSDLRALSSYRPPCIVSDVRYVLESCAERLARCFTNAHVEIIEVADLTEYDLEPTKNNVFVRGCDEDSANVCILFFRGEIPERAFDMAKNFLQTDKRKKFRLNRPGVVIDLSPVMPICFADRENSNLLRDICDFIPLAGYSDEEKKRISGEIFAGAIALYGADGLNIPECFHSRLSAFSIDEMARIINELVLDNRKNRGKKLTEEQLSEYIKSQSSNRKTFGFGGGAHEGC